MKRRTLIKGLAATVPSFYLSKAMGAGFANGIGKGPFEPTWESLAQYKTPNWFRDAKFGIWAHWGPQCQPEHGDWYGVRMYDEGSDTYKYHVNKYGHPSRFGFKDVIHDWKAEKWEPEALLDLYKKAGAKYFFALANHHDNMDLWNSRYQQWNSVNVGPQKDLIKGWAKAAKNHGLKFGVSVHASHAWRWFELSQSADKKGAMAGVPYDGKLTATDGAGKWWQGLNPQDLYAQNHDVSPGGDKFNGIFPQWDWGNGVVPPSTAYCEKFYNRTIELLDKYEPDLIYFDDTVLPLHPVSDVGLRIAAHHYNSSIKKKGKLEAVLFGKVLNPEQRQCMVWDIERGQSNEIEPLPWQTDTCIGDWHYDRRIYENNKYKSAKTVVHTLIDVVSKNGNLLLNIPLRGDGSPDEKELAVVEEISAWVPVHGEGIFGTRPWKVFGEGPASENAAPIKAQGFNEGKGKPFTSEDIRFTTKGSTVYAFVLGWPESGKVTIKTMKKGGAQLTKAVENVTVVSSGEKLSFEQTDTGLVVTLGNKPKLDYALGLKVV